MSSPLVVEGAPAKAVVGTNSLPSGAVAQPSSDPVSLAAELAGTINDGDNADKKLDVTTPNELQAKSENAPSTNPPIISSEPIKLGGLNGSGGIPAYALLVGMMESSDEILSIPITRLPTTFGKEHQNKDPSFVGLKESSDENAPKLSKSMCCIFYRDAHGGKLGRYQKKRKKEAQAAGGEEGAPVDPLDGMIYKPYENNDEDEDNEKKSTTSPDDVLRLPGMDAAAPLPQNGFYAIECTGRKIVVGGRTIKKGQFAMLNDGMPIKIASHCFYFLLPKSSSSVPPPSIKVQLPPVRVVKMEDATSAVKSPKNERESLGSIGGSIVASEIESAISSPSPPAKTKARKSEEVTSSSTPYDDKSDPQLLQLLAQKVSETVWGHEGQKIGSTIAIRVCRAAAKSIAIRNIALAEGGVTQREIMDWMNDPTAGSIFTDYERMMLTKIERKSFMSTCLKALVRAGYTKNEVKSGNAFRWNLPGNVSMSSCAVMEGVSPGTVSKVDAGSEENNELNNEVKQVEQSGAAEKTDPSDQRNETGTAKSGQETEHK